LLAAIILNGLKTYRFALLALCVLALYFMIQDMDFALFKAAIPSEATSGGLKFAGLFLFSLPMV
jgi:hypothetical protein